MKISCLNPVSNHGLKNFDDKYEIIDDYTKSDAIIVRSAQMKDIDLPDNVLAVARAGAGVNNIPLDKYASKGVVVFNTPGANANGVKELVVAGLLLASRDIVGGINWCTENKNDENIAQNAEKAKKAFGGYEIKGKKLGVIGLGAIGVLVANACKALGMEVYGCDPYLSVEHALNLNTEVIRVKTNEELYSLCDYITIHVPLLDSTKKMINKEVISLMKENAVILNFARDLLVDEEEVIKALDNKKIAKYVTDFPNQTVINKNNVIVIPHLGASTEESEDNCAVMAVNQIKEFLENGNIINSVNYPNVDASKCHAKYRITVAHKNVPNMISQITSALTNNNIQNMVNKSNGDYAYTVIDVNNANEEIVNKLKNIPDVYKVRLIK